MFWPTKSHHESLESVTPLFPPRRIRTDWKSSECTISRAMAYPRSGEWPKRQRIKGLRGFLHLHLGASTCLWRSLVAKTFQWQNYHNLGSVMSFIQKKTYRQWSTSPHEQWDTLSEGWWARGFSEPWRRQDGSSMIGQQAQLSRGRWTGYSWVGGLSLAYDGFPWQVFP